MVQTPRIYRAKNIPILARYSQAIIISAPVELKQMNLSHDDRHTTLFPGLFNPPPLSLDNRETELKSPENEVDCRVTLGFRKNFMLQRNLKSGE